MLTSNSPTKPGELSRTPPGASLLLSTPALFASRVSRGTWLPARHLLTIDQEIVNLIERRVPEWILSVELPPRHGKSEFLSKYTPAWFLCRYPTRHVLATSYAAQLAHRWGRASRSLVEEHGPQFGVYTDPARRAAAEWTILQHGGGMLSAGVGGPLTGRGFDLGIVDDPIKNAEQALSPTISEKHWDWWQSTFLTRRHPGGVIVLVGTRWGEHDLQGRVQREAEKEYGLPVRVLRLPAIAEHDDPLGRDEGEALWPDMWPRQHLEAIRDASEPYWFNALYQGAPESHRMAEWPAKYFGWQTVFSEWPRPDETVLRVMTLDPALGRSATSDYSAITYAAVAKGGQVYVDASIERRDISRMVADTIDGFGWFKPDVFGMETNGFAALEELLVQSTGGVLPPLATITQHVDKVARIKLSVGPMLRHDRLRFLKGSIGAERLLEQLRAFPKHAHDDGPDSLEMALRIAREYEGGITPSD